MKTSFLCSCTQPKYRQNTVKRISRKLHYNDSLICSSSSTLAWRLLHHSIKNKISKRSVRKGKLRQTFVLNFLLKGSGTSEISLELRQQSCSPQTSGVPRTRRLLAWKGHLQPARGEWWAWITCTALKPDHVTLFTSGFPVLLFL